LTHHSLAKRIFLRKVVMKRNLATEVISETEQLRRPELVEEPESQEPDRPKELKERVRLRACEIYQQWLQGE
jgi:hypothetical protein